MTQTRKRALSASRGLLLLAAVPLVLPAPAHAYIDASAGSMLLQLLAAGLGGAAVALKVFWKRLFPKGGDKREPGHPPHTPGV